MKECCGKMGQRNLHQPQQACQLTCICYWTLDSKQGSTTSRSSCVPLLMLEYFWSLDTYGNLSWTPVSTFKLDIESPNHFTLRDIQTSFRLQPHMRQFHLRTRPGRIDSPTSHGDCLWALCFRACCYQPWARLLEENSRVCLSVRFDTTHLHALLLRGCASKPEWRVLVVVEDAPPCHKQSMKSPNEECCGKMGQGTHTNPRKLVSWLILRWALDSKHGSTTPLEHSKLLNSHSRLSWTLFAFLVGHRITSHLRIQRTTTFVTPCASATDFSSILERGERDRYHSVPLNVFYSPIT